VTEPNGDDITDQESDQELDDLAKLVGYDSAEDARNDLDNT
jgi:hypothetical protein